MVGLKIPLIGMHHAYVTTDRIEGIEGMPNVRDHDASVYLKLQGDALHIGGYEPNPILIEKVCSSMVVVSVRMSKVIKKQEYPFSSSSTFDD